MKSATHFLSSRGLRRTAVSSVALMVFHSPLATAADCPVIVSTALTSQEPLPLTSHPLSVGGGQDSYARAIQISPHPAAPVAVIRLNRANEVRVATIDFAGPHPRVDNVEGLTVPSQWLGWAGNTLLAARVEEGEIAVVRFANGTEEPPLRIPLPRGALVPHLLVSQDGTVIAAPSNSSWSSAASAVLGGAVRIPRPPFLVRLNGRVPESVLLEVPNIRDRGTRLYEHLAFSPDGEILVARVGGSLEETPNFYFVAWDTRSGRLVGFQRFATPLQPFRFSSDSRYVAGGDLRTPTLRLWDRHDGFRLLREVRFEHPSGAIRGSMLVGSPRFGEGDRILTAFVSYSSRTFGTEGERLAVDTPGIPRTENLLVALAVSDLLDANARPLPLAMRAFPPGLLGAVETMAPDALLVGLPGERLGIVRISSMLPSAPVAPPSTAIAVGPTFAGMPVLTTVAPPPEEHREARLRILRDMIFHLGVQDPRSLSHESMRSLLRRAQSLYSTLLGLGGLHGSELTQAMNEVVAASPQRRFLPARLRAWAYFNADGSVRDDGNLD